MYAVDGEMHKKRFHIYFSWRKRYSFECVEWTGKSIYFPSPSLLFCRQRIQFELVEVWYVSRWWKNCATLWRHSELELPTNLRKTLWKRTLRLQSFIWKSEDNTFLDENVGVWNVSTFFKHSNMLKQTNHVLMWSFLELRCVFVSFCERWQKDVNMRHSSAFLCQGSETSTGRDKATGAEISLVFACVL